MPVGKPYKKSYRRKKRAYKKKTPMPMVIGGYPKSALVKLRYVGEVTINAGAAVVASQVYTANGLFDPNITGVGHQPSNFDSWMARYDHYTVLGAKIKADYIPTTTVNDIPGILGCILSDDGTRAVGAANLPDLMEQPNNRVSRTVPGPLYNTPRVVQTFSAAKFFGKKKSVILGDDQYRGSATTNPSDQAYFELYVYSVAGNNPAPLTFLITIDYVALFSERKPSLYS